MSKHFIVIPLYDHTSDMEVDEILADLKRQGFAHTPYQVRGVDAPEDTTEYTLCTIHEAGDCYVGCPNAHSF